MRPSDTDRSLRRHQTLTPVSERTGLRTFHIGKWHLGNSSTSQTQYAPNAKGYDYYFGFMFQPDLPGPNGGSDYYNNPWLRVDNGNPQQYSGHLTNILADDVIRILSELDTNKPFFITYWPLAPHSPDRSPAEWASKYPDNVEGRYAANVSSLDESVGKILAQLDASGRANDTIVLFLSDNGGTISQHPNGVGSLRGSKHTTFEGGIKAPMIVRWPGHVAPGSKNRNLVASMDIFPTLAEIVGLNTSEAIVDGQSLVPLLNGSREFPDRLLFWEHKAPGDTIEYAVRDKRWKYIIDNKGNNRKYLFNLNQDPGETTNLLNQYPNVVNQLQAAYEAWRWDTAEVRYEVNKTKGNATINGKTMSFGKEYGYAQVPHNTRFNPDIFAFTINLWVDPNTESDKPRRLVSKGLVWRVFLASNDKLRFMAMRHSDSKYFTVESTATVPKNQWTHIAITMELDGELKIFINGKLDTSTTYVPIRADRRVLDIGNSQSLNQPFFGSIYDLRFFNDALTGEEITKLYQTTRP